MLFNSTGYLLFFLPLVVAVFFYLSKYFDRRLAVAWLTIASFFFYGWWDYRYLPLLFGSALFNFSVGRKITKLRAHGQTGGRRWMWSGIAANLLLLGYFKYANFFLDSIGRLTEAPPAAVWTLFPLAVTGISFFTFTQIAYLVDAARGEAEEYDFVSYALFVSFFPHLIAGPILHHKEMMPQFRSKSAGSFSRALFSAGLSVFLIGLAKKVVVADSLALYATPMFAGAARGDHVTFFEGWVGVLAYTFQIYFDFSGYSDMAIGAALMMGIRFPLNFNSPYRAGNIREFWRRWHMTLSRFLRDYLYIPLGGNRRGSHHVNIMITMLLGGLWHGAGWTFIIWGGLHGLYLSANHAWRAAIGHAGLSYLDSHALYCATAAVLTFLAVVFAWVFFRADNFAAATAIIRGMVGQNGFVLPGQIVAIVPGLSRFVESTGTLALLGRGTVMGTVEIGGLLMLCFAVCLLFPPTHLMSRRQQLIALFLSTPFMIHAVLFARAPSPFLYFQF